MVTPKSMHRPAPLRLRELVFPRISIQALVPDDGGDSSQVLDLETTEIGFQYQPNDEDGSVQVGMRLRTLPLAEGVPNKDRFYEVDIEVFSVFEMVGTEHRDAMAEYLRKVAAASALLGSIREQVAMTTARGPWGVLTIPLVGMDAVIDRPKAQDNAEPVEDKSTVMPEKKARPRRKKTEL